ncbi:MAG: hypothetical protein GEU80_06290 [Dehalococcoidia bacterium]|nr:hypothetical protein [Dehalococcoidia bacterium]
MTNLVEREAQTETARNIDVVRRALSRRLARGVAGERGVLDPEFYAPDFRQYGPARQACGGDTAAPFGEVVFDGFSQPEVDIRHMEAIGGRVVTHVTFRGKHTDRFQGHAATGRQMYADAVLLHCLQDGRISEEWSIVRWR